MSIKALMVGKTLVCQIKGKMYQKPIASDEERLKIMEKALNTNEEDDSEIEELIKMVSREKTHEEIEAELDIVNQKREIKLQESLLLWMEDVKLNGDENFAVKGNKLYMKGINITIPEFLVREFVRRRDSDEDTTALQNFWKRCALNSDPRTREDLYKFLMNHDMVVTPKGYFVAYRNVSINGNKELDTPIKKCNDFISEQWLKVKGMKKSPTKYDILRLSDKAVDKEQDEFIRKSSGWLGKLTTGDDYDLVGNLNELYEKLSDVEEDTSTMYTDNYTKTMEITIGNIVSIPKEECNSDPDEQCSRGLHLGSPIFVRQGSFGQEGLVCLCDPMKVVAVPYAGGEKLRTSEYLPIGVAEYDKDGKIIPLDMTTFEHEYSEISVSNIDKMLTNAELESLKDHEILPKELDLTSLNNIVKSLNVDLTKMNDTIHKRMIN